MPALKNILYCIACVLAFTACKKQYVFEYKFAEGDEFKQRLTIDVDVKQRIDDDNIESATNLAVFLNYKITNAINQLYTVEVRCAKMEMEHRNIAGSFTLSSADTLSAPQGINPLFQNIIDVPVKLTVDEKGGVQSVSGIDKLFETPPSTATGYNTKNELVNEQANAMKQQFIAEIVHAFNRAVVYFPPQAVGVGDSWNVSTNLGQLSISIDTKITLQKVENNAAVLFANGYYATPDSGITKQIQGEDVTMHIKAQQQGTIIIDLNTGWTISNNMEQNVDAHLLLNNIKSVLNNRIKVSFASI